MDINKIYNIDCMKYMKDMSNNAIDLTLTDIPYGEVQRVTNGLSKLKSLDTLQDENEVKFDLTEFLEEIYRITKNTVCIFCGYEQFSTIFAFFASKPGTTRTIVYQKTNPVPSNGQYVYLNGVELCVWFKKRGAKTFNAHCKNTVFQYPIFGGKKRIHKTQKHPELIKELILDNSNEGDLIFDPCAGGCTTAWMASKTNRNFICCELNKDFYNTAINFLIKEIDYKE